MIYFFKTKINFKNFKQNKIFIMDMNKVNEIIKQ